jgi:RNA polymerase sigma-70 factor, ECF subfamily
MVSMRKQHSANRDIFVEYYELNLLKRIAARDRPAMTDLYYSYYHRLANFFARLSWRSGLVEQMTVDILAAVWCRAGSFDQEQRVSTWIISMAYRRALELLEGDEFPCRPGMRTPPRDKLGIALMEVPLRQRALLALIYCLGCSCDEVAAILDRSTTEVNIQLLAARMTLRIALSNPAGASQSSI